MKPCVHLPLNPRGLHEPRGQTWLQSGFVLGESETLRPEDKKMSYFRLPRSRAVSRRTRLLVCSLNTLNPARNISFISSTINKNSNPLSLRIIGMELTKREPEYTSRK